MYAVLSATPLSSPFLPFFPYPIPGPSFPSCMWITHVLPLCSSWCDLIGIAYTCLCHSLCNWTHPPSLPSCSQQGACVRCPLSGMLSQTGGGEAAAHSAGVHGLDPWSGGIWGAYSFSQEVSHCPSFQLSFYFVSWGL